MTTDLNQEALREAGIGSFFRPSQLEQLGIIYHRLRQLEAKEVVERVGRGLYRLADAEPTERYSIASVCARVPNAIVCLLSALQVHEIGTQSSRAKFGVTNEQLRAITFRTKSYLIYILRVREWSIE